MTNKTDPTDSLARLDALEAHVAHQDHVIDELNDVVLKQWREIEALKQQLERLKDRVQAAEDTRGEGGAPDAPPPHY